MNYLMHYGIPMRSGRYPYGSGKRPYQNSSNPITRFRMVRAQKSAAKKYAQKKEAEEAKQIHDENKGHVLKSGSASAVLSYQGELTNAELNEAVNRLKLEATLKEYSQKEIQSGMAKVDEIMKGVKTGTQWLKIGTEAYNAMAEIYNATEEGKKNPLTLVGKGGGDKK